MNRIEERMMAKWINNRRCPCPHCTAGITSDVHQTCSKRPTAAILKRELDWNEYPNLRKVFEHRPAVNNYWHELVHLIDVANS